MFHKKLNAVLAAAVFFSLTCNKVIAASRNITSLKLDFLRTEEILSTGEQSPMTGTIIYNKNPFVFIFQVKTPVVQTLYINEQSAYIFDNNTIYDAFENKDFLEQTCTDFLNWFKSDYGISESSFKPGDRWLEQNYVATQWDCYNFENQPLNKIIVYSDAAGRFKRLKMYVNSDSLTDALVTDTSLYDFTTSQGYSYPTTIISDSYDNGEPFLETTLVFSNVSFILSDNDLQTVEKLVQDSNAVLCEYPVKDISESSTLITPLVPQAVSYKVSIPSVLVGASYKFYKKFITSQDMSNCPFYPSCSQFMLEAVSSNGVFGFFQGLERLKRCTATEHQRDQYPTLSNGKHYDPVPVKPKNN